MVVDLAILLGRTAFWCIINPLYSDCLSEWCSSRVYLVEWKYIFKTGLRKSFLLENDYCFSFLNIFLMKSCFYAFSSVDRSKLSWRHLNTNWRLLDKNLTNRLQFLILDLLITYWLQAKMFLCWAVSSCWNLKVESSRLINQYMCTRSLITWIWMKGCLTNEFVFIDYVKLTVLPCLEKFK